MERVRDTRKAVGMGTYDGRTPHSSSLGLLASLTCNHRQVITCGEEVGRYITCPDLRKGASKKWHCASCYDE